MPHLWKHKTYCSTRHLCLYTFQNSAFSQSFSWQRETFELFPSHIQHNHSCLLLMGNITDRFAFDHSSRRRRASESLDADANECSDDRSIVIPQHHQQQWNHTDHRQLQLPNWCKCLSVVITKPFWGSFPVLDQSTQQSPDVDPAVCNGSQRIWSHLSPPSSSPCP